MKNLIWMVAFIAIALFMTSCQEESVFGEEYDESVTMRTTLETNYYDVDTRTLTLTMKNGRVIRGEVTGVFHHRTDALISIDVSDNIKKKFGLNDRDMIAFTQSLSGDGDLKCIDQCIKDYPGDENKKERRRCKWGCVKKGFMEIFQGAESEISES